MFAIVAITGTIFAVAAVAVPLIPYLDIMMFILLMLIFPVAFIVAVLTTFPNGANELFGDPRGYRVVASTAVRTCE